MCGRETSEGREKKAVAAAAYGQPAGGQSVLSDGVEKKHFLTPAGWSNFLNPGHWGGNADEKFKEVGDLRMQELPEGRVIVRYHRASRAHLSVACTPWKYNQAGAGACVVPGVGTGAGARG